MWSRFVFTPQEYTFPVGHAKKWCQNKKLSLIRHFWPPFWNAILTEKCPNFDHWGLFFRCHGNETTNQRLQNSLSWPGCLLIKWRTKRASSRFLHRKANCSRLFNGFYHFESRNKAHWTLINPKGLPKYHHFCT